jgi:putative 2OG-Fe(II) oxygenase
MEPDTQQVMLDSDDRALYEKLARQGFASLGKILSPDHVRLLQAEAAVLLDRPAQPWNQFLRYADARRWQPLLVAGPGRTTNYFDFLGVSPVLDDVLDKLFASHTVRRLLTRVLGPGRRVWYAQIRRAEVGARPLRMHQDRPGEVGLSILLSPSPSVHGTTVFLPGSHRWPRLIGTFPFLSPHYIRRFLKGAVGDPGDVYLFYNATWHGMASTDAQSRTAIILTFLPQSEVDADRQAPQELLMKVGPHLRSVLEGREPEGEEFRLADGDGKAGPDEIVGQRLPPTPLWSLWRLPMATALIFERVLALVRYLRRCLHRTDEVAH